jgi:hypothetical protein
LLHERLCARREEILVGIDDCLRREAELRPDWRLEREEAFEAYLEAAEAFVDERTEAYDPVGVQYLYSGERRRRAGELGFELDWYGGREEYGRLLRAAEALVEEGVDADGLTRAAERLIGQCGAYPDRSILSGYEAEPAVHKLPDYAVARAIERVVRAE